MDELFLGLMLLAIFMFVCFLLISIFGGDLEMKKYKMFTKMQDELTELNKEQADHE
jgi:hypothetical protein